MQYIPLNGEDRIPKLGFGTWQITGQQCIGAVTTALSVGYRHIDTAQAYENEAEVGAAINDFDVKREDIFLTTKVWRENLAYEDVITSTKDSLDKLKMGYVDLLLIHWPNENFPLNQTLAAMQELLKRQMARYIGVSNFPTALLRQAKELAPEIITNQVEYHPFLDQSQVLSEIRNLDMFLTAYCPLARGRVLEDATIKKIAHDHGKTPCQIALRWLLDQEGVVAIPKSSTESHIEENFDIFSFQLSKEEKEVINKLRHPSGRLISPDFAPKWDK